MTTRESAIAELLVGKAQAGDRRAFDELVARYRPRIYALALHMTGSASDADDVTQDVFVKAYRASHEKLCTVSRTVMLPTPVRTVIADPASEVSE